MQIELRLQLYQVIMTHINNNNSNISTRNLDVDNLTTNLSVLNTNVNNNISTIF